MRLPLPFSLLPLLASQRIFEVLDHGSASWGSASARKGCLLWPSSDVTGNPIAVHVPLIEGNVAIDPTPISGIAQTQGNTVITMEAIPAPDTNTYASPYCWIFEGNPQPTSLTVQIGPGSGTYSLCNQPGLPFSQYDATSAIEYTFINARSNPVILQAPGFVAGSTTITIANGKFATCLCHGNLMYCD